MFNSIRSLIARCLLEVKTTLLRSMRENGANINITKAFIRGVTPVENFSLFPSQSTYWPRQEDRNIDKFDIGNRLGKLNHEFFSRNCVI